MRCSAVRCDRGVFLGVCVCVSYTHAERKTLLLSVCVTYCIHSHVSRIALCHVLHCVTYCMCHILHSFSCEHRRGDTMRGNVMKKCILVSSSHEQVYSCEFVARIPFISHANTDGEMS